MVHNLFSCESKSSMGTLFGLMAMINCRSGSRNSSRISTHLTRYEGVSHECVCSLSKENLVCFQEEMNLMRIPTLLWNNIFHCFNPFLYLHHMKQLQFSFYIQLNSMMNNYCQLYFTLTSGCSSGGRLQSRRWPQIIFYNFPTSTPIPLSLSLPSFPSSFFSQLFFFYCST